MRVKILSQPDKVESRKEIPDEDLSTSARHEVKVGERSVARKIVKGGGVMSWR